MVGVEGVFWWWVRNVVGFNEVKGGEERVEKEGKEDGGEESKPMASNTVLKWHSLMKKVEEISILCGIDACAIIYGPNNPKPDIWPSVEGVQEMLTKFMEHPKSEQWKKMHNQETFLREKIVKTQEQLKKLKKENNTKEMTLHMLQCCNVGKVFDNATMADMKELLCLIDQYMKDIERNIKLIQAMENTNQHGDMYLAQWNEDLAMQNQQWNMELINDANAGASGNEFVSVGDVGVQNGFVPNPYIP
ncbi:hypothetical protein RJT34_13001 [Clitoria ternatea]|uniref:MADS-box domain-containing protein n=1 Tax=Clitoria ternatea TaxID=43366 RepID=A0AAN9PL16_CLITE